MPSRRFESFDTQSNDPRLVMSVMSFGPADSDAGSWDVLSTKSALAESEAGSWVVLATNSVRGSWKVPHKAESEAGSWVVEKDAADSEDPKGSKGPDDFPEVDPDDKSIYCDNCEMWLRNCDQWKEHFVRKKHKKNTKRNSLQTAPHQPLTRQTFQGPPGLPLPDGLSLVGQSLVHPTFSPPDVLLRRLL